MADQHDEEKQALARQHAQKPNEEQKDTTMRNETMVPTGSEEARTRMVDDVMMEIIEQHEAGLQPDIDEYVRSYPELAEELENRLMYYLLEGQEVIREAQAEYQTQAYKDEVEALKADQVAQQRKADLLDQLFPSPPLTSLLAAGNERGLNPRALAKKLGVTMDILTALEQHRIRLAGMPKALVAELAAAIDAPINSVQAYLRGPATAGAFHLHPDTPTAAQQADFLTLVDQSLMLTPEQKAYWRTLASTDTYTE